MCCHLPFESWFVRGLSSMYQTICQQHLSYQLLSCCLSALYRWNITVTLSRVEKKKDRWSGLPNENYKRLMFICMLYVWAWHIKLVIHKSNSSKHQFDGDLRNFRHTAHTDRNTNGSVRLFWFTVKKNLLAGANWCERKTLLLVARIEWMSHYSGEGSCSTRWETRLVPLY